MLLSVHIRDHISLRAVRLCDWNTFSQERAFSSFQPERPAGRIITKQNAPTQMILHHHTSKHCMSLELLSCNSKYQSMLVPIFRVACSFLLDESACHMHVCTALYLPSSHPQAQGPAVPAAQHKHDTYFFMRDSSCNNSKSILFEVSIHAHHKQNNRDLCTEVIRPMWECYVLCNSLKWSSANMWSNKEKVQ
jgi:hypothetical protein